MAGHEFPSDINRQQFEQVRELLEAARRKTRPRKHDLYDVFCAVLYFLDTGVAWRNMPPVFPPWRTVHEYFTQWTMQRDEHGMLLECALEKIGRPKAIDQLNKRLGQGAA